MQEDPDILLIFAALLNLEPVTSRYGFIKQARSSLKYALMHRGWQAAEDEHGHIKLVPFAVNKPPSEDTS